MSSSFERRGPVACNPVFFVASGVRFDLDALTASASSLRMVPVFLAALVATRSIPAVL